MLPDSCSRCAVAVIRSGPRRPARHSRDRIPFALEIGDQGVEVVLRAVAALVHDHDDAVRLRGELSAHGRVLEQPAGVATLVAGMFAAQHDEVFTAAHPHRGRLEDQAGREVVSLLRVGLSVTPCPWADD